MTMLDPIGFEKSYDTLDRPRVEPVRPAETLGLRLHTS